MPKKRGRSVEGRRRNKTAGKVCQKPTRAVRASPESEVELWTAPTRAKKPVPGKRWSARPLFVNHPEVPTDDLFIAPPQSKLTNRELGFDAKGKCLFGCDGMRSIKKGYTNIACHHYQCGFWETVDGKTQTPF